MPSELPGNLRAIATSGISCASEATRLLGSPAKAASEAQSPSEKLQEHLRAMEAKASTATSPSATSSAIPVFFESSTASQDPFDEAMSVKDLKLRLKQLGADFTGLAEKCELLAL